MNWQISESKLEQKASMVSKMMFYCHKEQLMLGHEENLERMEQTHFC